MAKGNAERAWTYGQYVEHYGQLEAEVEQLKEEIKIKHSHIDVLNKRLRDIGAQC